MSLINLRQVLSEKCLGEAEMYAGWPGITAVKLRNFSKLSSETIIIEIHEYMITLPTSVTAQSKA
jgi:hypothetical protein